ncbi:MAG: phosphoserine phosphatase [Pseudomonadota bacterium]
MTDVLNLVAPPGLLDAQVLGRLGGIVAEAAPRWLAPGEACDLALEPGTDAARTQAEARARLAGLPVDANAVPLAGRRKRLLVADMESTLIRNEMLDELAALEGMGERVRAITARAMNGEIDFRGALRERVALFAGRDVALLERAGERIEEMPGASVLVATMRRHGAFVAIVSGGFRFYTRQVREALGADHDEANELEVEGATITGRVREPILDAAGKAATLRRLAAGRGLAPGDAIATGDGANDLQMMSIAGLGVAFRAKPRVVAEARLSVAHGDLTALLFVQGYARDEFAAPSRPAFSRPSAASTGAA